MTSREIAQRAKQILVTKGWTKQEFARDEKGEATSATGPHAQTFCLLGATWRAFNDLDGDFESREKAEVYTELETRLNICVRERGLTNSYGQPLYSPSEFNDHPDIRLDDVLGILDCAIAKLPASDGTIEADGN